MSGTGGREVEREGDKKRKRKRAMVWKNRTYVMTLYYLLQRRYLLSTKQKSWLFYYYFVEDYDP